MISKCYINTKLELTVGKASGLRIAVFPAVDGQYVVDAGCQVYALDAPLAGKFLRQGVAKGFSGVQYSFL